MTSVYEMNSSGPVPTLDQTENKIEWFSYFYDRLKNVAKSLDPTETPIYIFLNYFDAKCGPTICFSSILDQNT